MAELKRTFTGGKMDKDTDERIVQNGLYREALNISVATSEDSDVGAAQNILGNIQVTEAIQSRSYQGRQGDNVYAGDNYHVASITNPQTNMLYRFIHTACPLNKGFDDENNPIVGQGIWMDRIVEFDTSKKLSDPWEEKESAVFVDIFKVVSQVASCAPTCSTGDIAELKLTGHKNLRQIRWGMRVIGPAAWDVLGDVTVEYVDYDSGSLTYGLIILNKPVSAAAATALQFIGDRNLNFGVFDVNEQNNGLRKITGLNIIDGMLFWTDNFSEPKKINI